VGVAFGQQFLGFLASVDEHLERPDPNLPAVDLGIESTAPGRGQMAAHEIIENEKRPQRVALRPFNKHPG